MSPAADPERTWEPQDDIDQIFYHQVWCAALDAANADDQQEDFHECPACGKSHGRLDESKYVAMQAALLRHARRQLDDALSRRTAAAIAEAAAAADRDLAHLVAGLDRDEHLALRVVQASLSWQDFTMPGELRDDVNAGTVAMGLADEDRAHIARHDPARVAKRVKALRKVLHLIQQHRLLDQGARADVASHYFEQGFDAACGLFIEALASGYIEETEAGS